MPPSSPKVSRSRRAARPSCPPRQTGAGAGENALRIRTTCAIGQEANRVVDVSRTWLRVAGRTASKELFLNTAVVVLTRLLMSENPDFKLPPDLSLDSIGAIQPNKSNGGNT